MDTLPKDGSRFDLLFESPHTEPIIATDIHWGLPPIGSQMTFVGSNNILSPWLIANYKMIGWRPHQKVK
jgi:hypothetical protein